MKEVAMRRFCLLALAGLFLLGACDSTQEIMAPEEPEMLQTYFHIVDPGSGPDGDYSMYYFDLNLFKNLLVKVGQVWAPGAYPGNPARDIAECPANVGDHTTDDYPFPPVDALPWQGATGFGYFSFSQFFKGRASGTMVPTHACWFDEWNGQGFPESAWVWGFVLPSLKPFALELESGGFPAPQSPHKHTLDKAKLYLEGYYPVSFIGELHHEDGLSLIG
jgi:hypothetical protein